MMYRANHPTFGDDPDLPGGTADNDETGLETVIREVDEEIGLHVTADQLKEIYSGSEYSNNGTHYCLYFCTLPDQPEVHMSWEHTSYEWISKDEFVLKARAAKDTYMRMAGDTLASL